MLSSRMVSPPSSLLPLAALLASMAHAQLPVSVNAPVAPEAIYIGRAGSAPGISVLDLNGFGQGTGALQSTRFPLNPNVGRPGVFPALAPGTSSLDAGGSGAMTLTQDVNGNVLLVAAPRIGRVADLQLGQPLDLLFHNERINPNVSPRNQINPALGLPQPGNTIMVAPHPNPPRLVLPPPNPAALIFAEEPTVTTSVAVPGRVTTTSPPALVSPLNLLVAGNPFSSLPGQIGLFGVNYDRIFVGPQPPPPLPPPPLPFMPYTCRQQVGHFLYAVDRDNRQVLVLNSNTFLTLATIPLPDPTSMAVAPNLRLLAVSNSATGTVSLIDIDPRSPTTHRVLASIPVPPGPSGIAWQPEGEDLLVCCTTANALAVIDGRTFRVRTTTTRTLVAPVEVAVGARQVGFGYNTATWFAFILSSNDRVSVYESGPSIIGPDDVITVVPETFAAARTLQHDLGALTSACWVTHRDSNGLAQVSRVAMVASPSGPLPYVPAVSDTELPDARQRAWGVVLRVGGPGATTPLKDRFSGNDLVDVAFDDILNFGALPDARSLLHPNLSYAAHSGKGHVKLTPTGLLPAHQPKFLFAACGDSGKVDAFELASGRKIATVDAPGVSALGHYWRQ